MIKLSLPAIGIGAAFILLLLCALYYPWATTFPMGGDAAAYSLNSQRILSFFNNPSLALRTITTSQYPLSQVLFAAFVLVPLDWPERFTWAMTVAHIAAGMALGLLLHRLRGAASAAAGMAIWALTTVTVNSHFEDGTLAQLASLTFLLFFFERIQARRPWQVVLFLAAAFFAHPLTGLVLLTTLVIALPMLRRYSRDFALTEQKMVRNLTIVVISLLVFGLIFAIDQRYIFSNIHFSPEVFPLFDLLTSFFAPFVVIASIGALIIAHTVKRHVITYGILLAFLCVVTLLAFNNHIGQGVLTTRFTTYFILATSLCAGYALPYLLRQAFRSPVTAALFILLLFTPVTLLQWSNANKVYRYYEAQGNYARLHFEEREAFAWMRDNLPAGSAIGSSNVNRHTEWIPVIAHHRWEEVPETDPLFTYHGDELRVYLRGRYHYIIFLKHREEITDNFVKMPADFPVVFENSGAVIIRVLEAR